MYIVYSCCRRCYYCRSSVAQFNFNTQFFLMDSLWFVAWWSHNFSHSLILSFSLARSNFVFNFGIYTVTAILNADEKLDLDFSLLILLVNKRLFLMDFCHTTCFLLIYIVYKNQKMWSQQWTNLRSQCFFSSSFF